ncbi:hypothetical protein EJB05_56852, partial [Eragrostis curvula]
RTVRLRGPIDKPWTHGERLKAQGFKCSYCPVARDSGGDVVACSNVPHTVRDIMLNLVASGKRKKMDSREHRLYVEKAIMDETYGAARRANIP